MLLGVYTRWKCYNCFNLHDATIKKVVSFFKGYTDISRIKSYIVLINHRRLNAINSLYKLGYSSSLCYCDIERYSYATVTYIYSVLPHSLPNMSFQWCLLCLSLVIWIILANYCNIIVHLTLTYINMFLLKMTSYKQFGCSWKSSCLTDKCLTPITFQTKGPCRGNSLKRAPKGNKVLENSPDSSHGICAANDNGDKKKSPGGKGCCWKDISPARKFVSVKSCRPQRVL